MMRESFNLIDQPWIPVALPDGKNAEWSLREFFHRAQHAVAFNEPSPLTYISVARFLLAVAHRAVDGPESPRAWMDIWQHGQFEANRFDAYLDRWHHRFDLFDPVLPFAQVGPEEDLGPPSPLTRFLLERSSVSAIVFWDHSHDANPPEFTPAEAARALLTAHSYGFAGAGGKFRDGPLIRGYVLLLEGRNLFETITFNLVRYDDHSPAELTRAGDAPWWEFDDDPPVKKDGQPPNGLTDLLTWRSRELRITQDADGHLVSPYRQRYFLPQSINNDPFLAYAAVQSGANKGEVITRKFQLGRALWRDCTVLLEKSRENLPGKPELRRPGVVDWLAEISDFVQEETGEPLPEPTLVACGLVNNQAKAELWRQERLRLPLAVVRDPALTHEVAIELDLANQAATAMRTAGWAFASAWLSEGERSPDRADVSNVITMLQLEERYWPRLEPEWATYLHNLASDADAARQTWTHAVLGTARAAFDDAVRSMGLDARSMRAQMAGLRTLAKHLAPLRPEEPAPGSDEVPTLEATS